MQTRLLILVRHAKAESFASADVERLLTPSGSEDARALGEWLAERGVRPDHALVSSAARTRETWQQVADGAGWSLEPVYDPGLYGTDEFGLLEVVRQVADDVGTLLVIGHNPTMGATAHLLDDGEGEGSDAMGHGSFPTATAAVFAVADAWRGIGERSGHLDAFHVARAQ